MATPAERADSAMQRVGKWRSLLTGWQLGTRAKGDPEGDAVRDHREATLILRVDVSALIHVLLEQGVISNDQWCDALRRSADNLNGLLEQRFPGVQASHDGLHIDHRAHAWMQSWKP